MVISPGTTEAGPEGDFVLSSNMSGENQLQNPVCVDASLCRLCRFPIKGDKDKVIVCKFKASSGVSGAWLTNCSDSR